MKTLTVSVSKIGSALIAQSRTTKKAIALIFDQVICIISVYCSFFLRLGQWNLDTISLATVSLLAVFLWSIVALNMGVYRAIFRFAGNGTIFAIVRAILVYSVPFFVICTIYTLKDVPRTIGLLQPIIFLLFLTISRITIRYILSDIIKLQGFDKELRRVLIYGAGSAGRQLAISLKHEPGFQLIGFVDSDDRLSERLLDGIRVFSTDDIHYLKDHYSITDIILAMPRNSRSKNREIMDSLQSEGIRVSTLPPIAEIVDKGISIDVVREINVYDLLGRDPVPPNDLLIHQTVDQKVVLVTGGGGSIGSELCRQIIRLNPSVLIVAEMSEFSLYAIDQKLNEEILDQGLQDKILIVPELINVADEPAVNRLFDRWRPNTVFHAAAYKHVPLVEKNPIGGIRNNIFGTYFCAKAAEKFGVDSFILISTDKAVRPTNVMGATKRVCELILQGMANKGLKTKFTMVRFGNVLGSSGSVVPRFEQQIRNGGPVTLTDKRITRYFMTIPEAAQLVIQAGALANSGEVCVLDMGESVLIFDLARSMIQLSGLTVKDNHFPEGDIEIVEVGLRPGEKLYEELLIADNPEPTVHERIFKAKEQFLPLDALEGAIHLLEDHLRAGNATESIAILKALVPEFSHN